MNPLLRRMLSTFGIIAILFSSLTAATPAQPVQASDTPDPASVTLVGSLQSELGCGGDWDPACADSYLTYDAGDTVWQGSFDLPGSAEPYEYKVALNNTWVENYGANAARDGGNISLPLSAPATVKFYYDHETHWITDNLTSVIATVPGSYQDEIGCPGDWQPDCLRSWLQDPDGDGTYSFSTSDIPAGSYEAKVAINENWDVNYGQDGAQNGGNILFSVAVADSTVTFTYDAVSHVLTIHVQSPGHFPDNNVEWDGVRHDSRDPLYRTPGGAVPAGTPVTLRLRTFHNDVTGASVRLYDLNANGQRFLPMQLAASGVSCYQAELAEDSCDFWEVTLPNADPNNLWYRFIFHDGSDTNYYADNTPALDGGLGAVSDTVVDQSYALMVYDAAFSAPAWAKDAFIYQIFPDRFRNGRSDNDAKTGDARYDDPVITLPWGTLPEGYCRNYDDGGSNCPWRFDDTPPDWSPTKEQPRGRDYYGGDLKGVDQYLDYLQSLGVNTLYFNPIFDAGSNHSYDTQDYYKIDPYFGTQKDWENLVKHANQRGMRIVLDGVFNHLSSDSMFFDRYNHYATVGACESVDSLYRDWFYFHDVPAGTGTCVGSDGTPNAATYDGWFSFDSIPVINKSLPEVQEYFLTGSNSVSRYWLRQGAGGWRMDVMGDASFPAGYWETFRGVVKQTKPDALIISETWQKDSTLLRMLRGDRADTTMNYRLRDAVIAFLAPGTFDSKGFADSGYVISATQFGQRLSAIREDYPDAAYYSLMNLLDSHDTERLLWTLTPGEETTAGKELDAANLAAGKQRVRLASLIQFTVPGAPTVFYGDEVGLTGDDDPDDRRTYPWTDKGGTVDTAMFSHYQALAQLRKANPVLVSGDFNMLLTDDAKGVVAYGRKLGDKAALVAVNRSAETQTVIAPVSGYLPDGVSFTKAYAVGNAGFTAAAVMGGAVELTLEANSALVLTASADLTPTAAPTGLTVTSEGSGQVSLAWNAVSGAAGYNLYRSPVSGGGYVLVNEDPLTDLSFTDSGLTNAMTYYYVVRALDAAGNESAASNEAQALPHLLIGWANTQWPETITHTISVTNRTPDIYGQVWIDGATGAPGVTPGLMAQVGYGPAGSNPATSPDWIWVDAVFNVQAGNNDEFKASLLPEAVGVFDYVYRYSTTNGRDWYVAYLNSGAAGKLTVLSSGDTTAPAVPMNLTVTSATTGGISLAWDAVAGDASLYGYEILRAGVSGGPYTLLALVTGTSYVDTDVAQEETYYYVVRSIDQSFNRSGYSGEVYATAATRTVTVVFNVTVPASTDATGRMVYIAGTLSRLDGGLPDWDPGDVVMTRVDETHWTITLTGKESTAIEYKYALGSWDYVEKGAACEELGNRLLTLNYGSDGVQVVNDTVLNWRGVGTCIE